MSTSWPKQQWIDRLEESVRLTIMDEHAPAIYVRLVYGFEFRDAAKQNAAIDHLRKGLERVFTRWPFLAGQIIHPPLSSHSARPPQFKVLYTRDSQHFNIKHFGNEIFAHENWKTFPYSYKELVGFDIPPALMKADRLTLSPNHPKASDNCHPLTLKATFIKGGLLLGFGFHHALCDGISIRQILSTFGNLDLLAMTPDTASLNLRDAFISKYSLSGSLASAPPSRPHSSAIVKQSNPAQSRSGSPVPQSRPVGPGSKVFSTKHTASGSNPSPSFQQPWRGNPQTSTGSGHPPTGSTTTPPNNTAEVLIFPLDKVRDLTQKALKYLNPYHVSNTPYPDGKFVSEQDTLSALIWITVTRARYCARLYSYYPNLEKAPSTFATAVNLRGPGGPFKELPQTYMGNMFHRAFTTLPMSMLLNIDPNDDNNISTLANVAREIKGNIQRVLSKKSPQEILGEPEISTALTGLDCSSWAFLGGDVDFNIPGTASKWPSSKPDWARKTWSANDGSVNFLPRRKEGNWEVLLALRVDDMKFVCDKLKGRGYMARTTFGWDQKPQKG